MGPVAVRAVSSEWISPAEGPSGPRERSSAVDGRRAGRPRGCDPPGMLGTP